MLPKYAWRDVPPPGRRRAFIYERAPGVFSLSFPEAPRGWTAEGEIITDWRKTLIH